MQITAQQFKQKYLKDSLPGIPVKAGDKVTFTNDYGVKFENMEVLGVCEPDTYGRCVHLTTEAYWFGKNPAQLKAVA